MFKSYFSTRSGNKGSVQERSICADIVNLLNKFPENEMNAKTVYSELSGKLPRTTKISTIHVLLSYLEKKNRIVRTDVGFYASK